MYFLFWVTGNWKSTVTSTRQENHVSDLHLCEIGSLFCKTHVQYSQGHFTWHEFPPLASSHLRSLSPRSCSAVCLSSPFSREERARRRNGHARQSASLRAPWLSLPLATQDKKQILESALHSCRLCVHRFSYPASCSERYCSYSRGFHVYNCARSSPTSALSLQS